MAKPLPEIVPLNELSKKTLGSYSEKVKNSILDVWSAHRSWPGSGRSQRSPNDIKDIMEPKTRHNAKRLGNRYQGARRASKRLSGTLDKRTKLGKKEYKFK